MPSLKRLLHRATRQMGLHVQRWRDPYDDALTLLRDVPVRNVVDGGAYHGSHSVRLAVTFPQATIHAFEPQAASFARLKSTTAKNPRVVAYPYALSNECSETVLYVNDQAFMTSLLESTEPEAMRPSGSQPVTTVTLDRWAVEQKVAAPELIKLDLQGHELAALHGAHSVLTDGVQIVITEVNFRRRYVGCGLFHEVAAYLDSLGFQFYRLYEIIKNGNAAWGQADALFVRSSLLVDRA